MKLYLCFFMCTRYDGLPQKSEKDTWRASDSEKKTKRTEVAEFSLLLLVSMQAYPASIPTAFFGLSERNDTTDTTRVDVSLLCNVASLNISYKRKIESEADRGWNYSTKHLFDNITMCQGGNMLLWLLGNTVILLEFPFCSNVLINTRNELQFQNISTAKIVVHVKCV